MISRAPQPGLEPTADCLEGSCSIHLSYWGTSICRPIILYPSGRSKECVGVREGMGVPASAEAVCVCRTPATMALCVPTASIVGIGVEPTAPDSVPQVQPAASSAAPNATAPASRLSLSPMRIRCLPARHPTRPPPTTVYHTLASALHAAERLAHASRIAATTVACSPAPCYNQTDRSVLEEPEATHATARRRDPRTPAGHGSGLLWPAGLRGDQRRPGLRRGWPLQRRLLPSLSLQAGPLCRTPRPLAGQYPRAAARHRRPRPDGARSTAHHGRPHAPVFADSRGQLPLVLDFGPRHGWIPRCGKRPSPLATIAPTLPT